ncbi:MAG TPA: competence/damage-inducible protein A [Bacteroidia bacterium]
MINASIVTIGDEILIGQIIDTNSAFISRELNKVGIRIKHKISIGDQREEIENALNTLIGKTDVIIFTGGLGPTNDDITKIVLNDYFGGKFVRHEETYRMLEEYYKSRNREFIPVNQTQADVPDVCTVLINKNGTAPGMMFEKDKTLVYSLPGVPYEMEALITEQVIPIIQDRYKLEPIAHATLQTVGIPESTLMMKIKNWEDNLPQDLKLAYLPSFGVVRLRLTCWEAGKYSESDLYRYFKPLYEILGEAIWAEGDVTMESYVFNLLKSKQIKVSFAESCTGGYLAHRLTSYAGSSEIFNGSIVSYSNEIKAVELGVSREDLKNFGAVSEQVVVQMAESVKQKFEADYGVATSGIAGPDGGTETKPVGTVWIAISGPNGTVAHKFIFTNNRERNIKLTLTQAFNLLRLEILKKP